MTDHTQNSSIDDLRPTRLEEAGAASAQPFSQKAHAFIDQASEALGWGSERITQLHQQYSDKAREQVRAKPLAALGVALAVGLVVSKLFTR